MTPRQLTDETADIIEKAVALFDEGIVSSQNAMYTRILAVVKELDLNSNGGIKTTTANLRIINKLNAEINNAILTESYQNRVTKFLSSFHSLRKANNSYFKTLSQTFEDNKAIFDAVTTQALELTTNTLLQGGLQQGVVQPIKSLLVQNITAGGDFDTLVDSLRAQIKGQGQSAGILQRHVQVVTTDALNQYNRNYAQVITDDLGLNWFLYIGGLKDTSRRYCQQRAGKYWHRKEIESSANDKWSGKNPATNSNTIFTYAGGFQCGHKYIAVLESAVPEGDLKRFREK